METRTALWILLLIAIREVCMQDEEYVYDYDIYGEFLPLNCSTAESIREGSVTYSKGGVEGSVLTYHCGPGRYPSPVSQRICGNDGEWSPMRLANGRLVSQATCRDILCPAQLQLDNGDFWPREQWFRIGTTQEFSCQEGFTLHGSAHRNCTISGAWTGSTPICDSHAGDCDDPGVPPGAQRFGGRFQAGDKFIYECQTGLNLLGSAERVCLETKEWSGATPRCQAPNTFDSPSDVAAAMSGSLAGIMDFLTPDSKRKAASFGRTFNMATGSRMNVFFLLDASGSITKEEFEKSKDAAIALILKLDSYEVQIKFHVLSFASEVKDIVNITDTYMSGEAEYVVLDLKHFNYNSHGRKTGTNIYAALYRVSEMIALLKKDKQNNHFNETQNIIVIQTDGYSNTGKNPKIALAKIRHLLGYGSSLHDHTKETNLDIYVFGIGNQTEKKEGLNALASNKRNEEHIFILKDYDSLGAVFNRIISDQSVTMCGVAQEETDTDAYSRPWHVTIPSTHCSGSIVSQHWVLTAAHCFARSSKENFNQVVDIQYGGGILTSSKVILHPKYNIKALRHKNVAEFYDYDVALIQVSGSIPLSWKARPICMPCTVPASRAMKKINSTCQEHEKELLSHLMTPASFVHKHSLRKETHIQLGSLRSGCVEKANLTLSGPTNVTMEEYVPRRLLCSGGSPRFKDAVSCKGDSGGSLFLQKRNRYFQVGVVSWGTINVCDITQVVLGRHSVDSPPPDARDFHINLFEIMPWLREHLGEEIQFLPEHN